MKIIFWPVPTPTNHLPCPSPQQHYIFLVAFAPTTSHRKLKESLFHCLSGCSATLFQLLLMPLGSMNSGVSEHQSNSGSKASHTINPLRQGGEFGPAHWIVHYLVCRTKGKKKNKTNQHPSTHILIARKNRSRKNVKEHKTFLIFISSLIWSTTRLLNAIFLLKFTSKILTLLC